MVIQKRTRGRKADILENSSLPSPQNRVAQSLLMTLSLGVVINIGKLE